MSDYGKIENDDRVIKRIREILEVVLSYAKLDFDKKIEIAGESDMFDALAAGINMLGEELQFSSASLDEKSVLLKEIHHRVKNNLQIVSSILNLQAIYVNDAFLKEKFQECQLRIRSMSLVHEKLYQSKDLSEIELNDYLKTLCENLDSTFNNGNVQFNFKPSLKDIYTEIDTVIPLGLILNELVSNSFKHAFANKKGVLEVNVSRIDDTCHIVIRDNGVGFEIDNSDQEGTSLGIQLVNSLVQQIDGKLTVYNENGISYKISFQVKLKKKINAQS